MGFIPLKPFQATCACGNKTSRMYWNKHRKCLACVNKEKDMNNAKTKKAVRWD